jgi:hypothetical protein
MVFGMEEAKMPEFGPGRSPAELWLNAWSKGAAIKGKQLELERQLYQSQLNATFREEDQKRKMAQMEISAANAVATNNRLIEQMNRDSFFKAQDDKRADFKIWLAQNNKNEQDADTTAFMEATTALNETDPDYHQKLRQIAAEHSKGANSQLGLTFFKNKGDSFNNYARKQEEYLKTKGDMLNDQMNKDLWGYERNDLTPLYEPNRWKDQLDPKTGKPTGKKFLQEPNTDPYTAKDTPFHYYTTDAGQLQSWSNQAVDIRDQYQKLPQQINDPAHGVYAYPSSTSRKDDPAKVQLAMKAMQPNSGATPQEQAGARRVLHNAGVQGY